MSKPRTGMHWGSPTLFRVLFGIIPNRLVLVHGSRGSLSLFRGRLSAVLCFTGLSQFFLEISQFFAVSTVRVWAVGRPRLRVFVLLGQLWHRKPTNAECGTNGDPSVPTLSTPKGESRQLGGISGSVFFRGLDFRLLSVTDRATGLRLMPSGKYLIKLSAGTCLRFSSIRILVPQALVHSCHRENCPAGHESWWGRDTELHRELWDRLPWRRSHYRTAGIRDLESELDGLQPPFELSRLLQDARSDRVQARTREHQGNGGGNKG